MPGSTSSPRPRTRRTVALSVLAAVAALAAVAVVLTVPNRPDDATTAVSSPENPLVSPPPATAATSETTAATTAASVTTAPTATTATTEVPAVTEPTASASPVPDPSPDELSGIVHLLTATDAADSEKRRYLEAEDAIVVPQTVSRIGLFRAPRGGSEVTGPVTRDGDTATAQLHAWSQGIPDVSMQIRFVHRDGTWRLSSSSVCEGVRTVGLPIYCNA